jgi:hypothetical protein
MENWFERKHSILMIKYILLDSHYKHLEIDDNCFCFQVLLQFVIVFLHYPIQDLKTVFCFFRRS